MKLNLIKLMHLLLVPALVLPISCSDSDDSPAKGEEPADESVVELTRGIGYYEGDIYNSGSDTFTLILGTDEVILNETVFSGRGKALVLQLNAATTDGKALPAGTYNSLLGWTGALSNNTFVPGSQNGTEYEGSYVYEYTVVAPVYRMVAGGAATVSVSGTTYTIELTATDQNDKELKFRFSGPLTFTDRSGPDEPDVPQVKPVDLTDLSQGKMVCLGNFYILDYRPHTIWAIYLADAGMDLTSYTGNGEMMRIELVTDIEVIDQVPAGTYSRVTALDENAFQPFNWVYGYDDQDGYPYGTRYAQNGEWLYNAIEGDNVVITKSDRAGSDDYTITFNFTTEDTEPVTLAGTYTGTLVYEDGASVPTPLL